MVQLIGFIKIKSDKVLVFATAGAARRKKTLVRRGKRQPAVQFHVQTVTV